MLYKHKSTVVRRLRGMVPFPCFLDHRLSCAKQSKFLPAKQGFGSGSEWIRIHVTSWIRIRIQYADPDPGGYILREKREKMQGK